jgi:hypothetical protein
MENYVINGKVVDITLENGKVVKAMTSYLENMVKMLDIDMDEAVLTWLEDEGYLDNEEQEELCAAANENKSLAAARKGIRDGAKEKKKTVKTVKENPTKEMVISEIAKCIEAIDGTTNIVVENKSKLITFELNNESFKIDLIQRRKPKSN